VDRVLAATLLVAAVCCVHGITAASMHPDQMVFLPLFHAGKWPFNPAWFEKPPLVTYFNYFFSLWPIATLGDLLGLSAPAVRAAQRGWSRLLATGLFLGSVGIAFAIARRSFGTIAARVVAVLLGTSAGFVAHTHHLTADVPVTFAMLVALYFCQRVLAGGGFPDYLCAGAATGIAAATKYNGLAIGIALVTAHALRVGLDGHSAQRWRRIFFSREVLLGLVMVPVGFVVANPFAVLDFQTFRDDFLYNYIVAPVYEGQTGHSWGQFFVAIMDILGVPAFALGVLAAVVAVALTFRAGVSRVERATMWTCLATFAVYYLQFASFPRLPTRFVLPIVPVWLLLTGPCWARVPWRGALTAVMLAVGAYNVACAAYVGRRFLDDPRLAAKAWVQARVPTGTTVESDIYSPDWNGIGGTRLPQTAMPFVTGRERLFARLFPGDEFVTGSEEARRAAEARVAWFAPGELAKRDPELIASNSLYHDRFLEPGIRSDLYPSMRDYFRALLAGEYPYEIVYDRESPPVPWWAYPREIDFLHNRMTILARRGLAFPAGPR
jgi:hypothetical protein